MDWIFSQKHAIGAVSRRQERFSAFLGLKIAEKNGV